MNRLAPLAGLLAASLSASFPARAESPAIPGSDTGGGAGDFEGRSGAFQLMLQAPPIVADSSQAGRGLAINQGVKKGSVTFGTVGIGLGVGYTLTSVFEVGGAVSFSYRGDTSDYEILAEPFVKLNFGPALGTGAINPFVLAGLGFGAIGFGNGVGGTDSYGEFVIDLDPGVEWLFGGRWGADVYVPVQLQIPTGQLGPFRDSQMGFTLGFAYGLVGYL